MRSIFLLVFPFVFLLHGCGTENLPDKALLMKDVRFLAADDLQGRKTGTEGNTKAQAYLIERFQEIGIKPLEGHYNWNFPIEGKANITSGTNLIGKIEGKSEKLIIITAHYDHVGVSASGEIFNGADDNASGVAGLLATARYFANKQPNHTMIFIAFDAEEIGLLGAKHFVKNLPFKKELITFNLNMDMISRSNRNEIYAAGSYHYPQFKPILEEVASVAPIKLSLGHDQPGTSQQDWTLASDHAPFHQAGIPFLYFGVEDHPDYHQPTDDWDKISPEFLEDTTTAILDVIRKVDAR